jgi:hypothetical protein
MVSQFGASRSASAKRWVTSQLKTLGIQVAALEPAGVIAQEDQYQIADCGDDSYRHWFMLRIATAADIDKLIWGCITKELRISPRFRWIEVYMLDLDARSRSIPMTIVAWMSWQINSVICGRFIRTSMTGSSTMTGSRSTRSSRRESQFDGLMLNLRESGVNRRRRNPASIPSRQYEIDEDYMLDDPRVDLLLCRRCLAC